MRTRILLCLFALVTLTPISRADEGMWLPFQLEKVYKEMKAKGLKLKLDELYNEQHPSLKDAVVSMGGFCTGELISSQGLMLTNHHCGFDAIRSHSTPENDYLTDGFWAMSKGEEKPVPGLYVSIVISVEDVTATVLEGINDGTSEDDRAEKVRQVSQGLAAAKMADGQYKAAVREFFGGNEYYLITVQVFDDVRLVGAPPSSIGKFGGDTDNWMWPRHTGDFSIFRVYAGKDNQPAEYSQDNVPYQPKHYFPVSMDGVDEGDYTMVYGYPGSTDRYLSSWGVEHAAQVEQPRRVDLRRAKLDIMERHMEASDEVRLKYASKRAQVSNYWKYFMGQSRQLEVNDVAERKRQLEKQFSDWMRADKERMGQYSQVLPDIESAYEKLTVLNPTRVYFIEGVVSIDLNNFIYQHLPLLGMIENDTLDTENWDRISAQLTALSDDFYKKFDYSVEEELLSTLMQMYYDDVPQEQQPEMLLEIGRSTGGRVDSWVIEQMRTSIFSDKDRYMAFLENPSAKALQDDKLMALINALLENYRIIMLTGAEIKQVNDKLDAANRLFIRGIREMNPGKAYAPDANSTLRLTYGNVAGYDGRDAIHYNYYTTMKGIMEKEDPENPEFIVPEKLKELYEKEDYGAYIDADGTMHVCFIHGNDITGGNSGSPVINANGELIGCAFDGNWEAMSGDIAFEDNLQRTISVDIRYVLFIIDKFAGAGHLVDEMTLVGKAAKKR